MGVSLNIFMKTCMFFSFYVYFSRYALLFDVIFILDDVLNLLITKNKKLFVILHCCFVHNN